jgi:hypothetical protein
MADKLPDLVRIAPSKFHALSYWLVCGPLPLRPRAVREVVNALRAEVTYRRAELLPPT